MVEPGDEASIGRFGWGTRKSEERELVEMLRIEERVGGCGHVLPEEGEPQNHLQERTAQYRARPTGGAATAAREDGQNGISLSLSLSLSPSLSPLSLSLARESPPWQTIQLVECGQ